MVAGGIGGPKVRQQWGDISAVLGSESFPVLISPLPIIWQEKLPRTCASHPKSSGPINTPLTPGCGGGGINEPTWRYKYRHGQDPEQLGGEF